MLTTVLAVAGLALFAAALIGIWAFGMWDYVTGRAERQRQATAMLLRGPEAWGLPTDRHLTRSQERQDAGEAADSGRSEA